MDRSGLFTGVLSFLVLIILIVPNAVLANKETFVPKETAFEIAAVALAQHVLIPTPSLDDDQMPGQGWESARIGPAKLIYDINGEPFVHIFPVIVENDVSQGSIWVSADKLLGTTVISIHETMELPDFELAGKTALRQVDCRYPGWQIQQTLPVVYSYPRIGVMLTLSKPGTRETADIVFDAYDFSEAPIIPANEKTRRLFSLRNRSWSYFDQIPEIEREERIHGWQVKYEWDRRMLEILRMSDGFPHELTSSALKDVLNLKRIFQKYYANMQCEQYTTRDPWTQYCQSGVPYCAAAVGRNIAAYYGKNHPEAKVAQLMGITKQNWPTVQGEQKYYNSLYGLNKKGTKYFTDATPAGTSHLKDWKSIKTEILKDTDFTIPSSIGLKWGYGEEGPGGWQQPGHWNVLNYIEVCRSPNGAEDVRFGIFDPYPPTNCSNKVESFLYLKNILRSHTIPQDPGDPPKYPPKPTFEPWRCKLHWYRMMNPASCKKWDDMLKRVAHKNWEIP